MDGPPARAFANRMRISDLFRYMLVKAQPPLASAARPDCHLTMFVFGKSEQADPVRKAFF